MKILAFNMISAWFSIYSQFAKVVCLLLLAQNVCAAWEPTFVDNFDGNKLSLGKWVKGQENLDRQLQAYRDEAIVVGSGSLNLKIIDEPYFNRPFIAGAVTTQGLFAQQYGYFEARAKMAGGDGLWPAFWLMPITGQWTSEIDIFEYIGNKNAVHNAFHYDWRSQNQHGKTKSGFSTDLASDYHVYGLLWTPDKIEFFIDGRLSHRISDRSIVAKANKPMFVMLNTALASQHTGWISGVNATTNMAQSFAVDYVRVYEQSPTGRYSEIPSSTSFVANTENHPYDNVAVSIESLDEPNATKAITRGVSSIRDSLKLTAHASIDAVLWISLHKARNFDRNGRFEADKLQVLEKPVRLAKAGDSMVVDYEFPQSLTNAPGLYHVDVVVRDKQARNSNRAAARYKTFQFLSTAPTDAIYFDAYVTGASATREENAVEARVTVRLQELLLSPKLTVYFRLKDSSSGRIYADTSRQVEHISMGTLTFEERLTWDHSSNNDALLEVAVGDATGKNRSSYFSIPVRESAAPSRPAISVR